VKRVVVHIGHRLLSFDVVLRADIPHRRLRPTDQDQKQALSFTIITTPPNELCAALYNWMPAVLKPEAWPRWLGEQPAELAQIKALLAPYPSEGMIAWPVSARRQRARTTIGVWSSRSS
jgi:putative SOS response-associated peptidase YedK